MRPRTLCCSAALFLAVLSGCSGRDRERQMTECMDIQRSMYVAGQVGDCLVSRFGWSAEAASAVERERTGAAHPDSASQGDSGRVGR